MQGAFLIRLIVIVALFVFTVGAMVFYSTLAIMTVALDSVVNALAVGTIIAFFVLQSSRSLYVDGTFICSLFATAGKKAKGRKYQNYTN